MCILPKTIVWVMVLDTMCDIRILKTAVQYIFYTCHEWNMLKFHQPIDFRPIFLESKRACTIWTEGWQHLWWPVQLALTLGHSGPVFTFIPRIRVYQNKSIWDTTLIIFCIITKSTSFLISFLIWLLLQGTPLSSETVSISLDSELQWSR